MILLFEEAKQDPAPERTARMDAGSVPTLKRKESGTSELPNR